VRQSVKKRCKTRGNFSFGTFGNSSSIHDEIDDAAQLSNSSFGLRASDQAFVLYVRKNLRPFRASTHSAFFLTPRDAASSVAQQGASLPQGSSDAASA